MCEKTKKNKDRFILIFFSLFNIRKDKYILNQFYSRLNIRIIEIVLKVFSI